LEDWYGFFAYFLDLPELAEFAKISFRLLLAFVIGSIIGLERERYFKDMNKSKAAGFRTYTLVCFGSCLFGVASQFAFSSHIYTDMGTIVDPGRIAAQIPVALGFLGAGVILKSQQGEIKGLTTAAGLWVTASLGLLISSRLMVIGVIGAIFVYIILDFHRMFPKLFRNLTTAPKDTSPHETGEGDLNDDVRKPD
jgi:putative Mg2+ transporter-C (MgtC) family protein